MASKKVSKAMTLRLLLIGVLACLFQIGEGGYQSLFDDAVFKMSNFSTSFKVSSGRSTLNVGLSNLTCEDVSIDKLWITPNSTTAQSLSERSVDTGLRNISVSCAWVTTFDYYHFVKVATGEATLSVDFTIDAFELGFTFRSDDFALQPPTNISMDSCAIDVDWANDFSFFIDFSSDTADTSKKSLTSFIEDVETEFADSIREVSASALNDILQLDQENNIVCQMLDDVIETALSPTLEDFAALLVEYQGMENQYVDRLNAEASISDINEDWVDFQTSDIFGMAFDAFNSGFTLEDLGYANTNSSAADLLRAITQGTGNFDINAGNVTLLELSFKDYFAVKLDLSQVSLSGLDSVQSFDPVKVYGPYTIESNISLADLRGKAELVLNMEILTGMPSSFRRRLEHMGIDIQDEVFELALDLDRLDVSLALALAINSVDAWNLGFGSVLENPFDCILTTFDFFQASRVWGKLESFSEVPDLSGLISPEVNQLMQGILETALHVYGPSGLAALPGLMLEKGPDLVTSGFGSLIENSDCPEPTPYTDDPFFDFNSDSYFRDLVDMVDEDVIPDINDGYIAPACRSQSGVDGKYILQEDASMTELTIPVGTFSISAAEVSLNGLDSMYDIEFMESPEPYVLHNSFKLGGALSNDEGRRMLGSSSNDTLPPVIFSLVLEMNFAGDATNFVNKFEFWAEFQGFYATLDILAKFNRTDFDLLTIEEILDISCVMSRLDDAELQVLEAGFEAIHVGLRCINCTSPGMLEMEEKVKNETYQEELTATINEWISTILRKIREKMDHEQLALTIEEAREECEATGLAKSETTSSEYEAETNSRLSIFGIIGGMGATMILGMTLGCCLKFGTRGCCNVCMSVSCCCQVCCKKNEDKSTQTLSRDHAASVISEDENVNGDATQEVGKSRSFSDSFKRYFRFSSSASEPPDIVIEDRLEVSAPPLTSQFERRDTSRNGNIDAKLLAQRKSCLGFHPAVPWYASFGVLGMLFLNTFLFAIGHVITAANINVLFTILGDDILMDNVEGFSIGKSIKQLWDSGIIPLALLLASLSGAFPYIKVLTMGTCWLTPTRFMSATRRGKILDGFDTVGKWSMIDVYVLLLIMVAFGLKIENPNLNILPEGFYAARVFVDPAIGLVSFTAAAMLSLFTNNTLVYYHRNAIDADRQALQDPELAAAVADYEASRFKTQNPMGGDEEGRSRPARRRFSTWLEHGESASDLVCLCDHHFKLADGRVVRFTTFGKRVITLLLCVTSILVLVGLCIPSFGFEILGLIGMFMDIDEVQSWKPYSVLDTFAFAVRQAFESTNDNVGFIIGVLFLAFAYLLTAAFFPLFTLGGLLYIWLKPMTLHRQKWMYLVTEVFSAWSCVDVFVVGLIVGVMELGHISYVLLKPVCTHIMPLIEDVLLPAGLITEENATCLYISSSLEPGCGLLVMGAMLTTILSQIILRATRHAIEEREEKIEASVADFEDDKKSNPPNVGCLLRALLALAYWMRWIKYEGERENVESPSTITVSAMNLADGGDEI